MHTLKFIIYNISILFLPQEMLTDTDFTATRIIIQMNAHTWYHSTLILHPLYFFTIPLRVSKSGSTSVGLTLPLSRWMKSTSLTEGECMAALKIMSIQHFLCAVSKMDPGLILIRCWAAVQIISTLISHLRGRSSHEGAADSHFSSAHRMMPTQSNLFLLVWGQFGFFIFFLGYAVLSKQISHRVTPKSEWADYINIVRFSKYIPSVITEKLL